MVPQLNKITVTANQLAGRLRYVIENWRKITLTDKHVLETVEGYRIPLKSKPIQWRKRVTKSRSIEQETLLSQVILDLASKGAVHQVVEQDDQFLSTLFVVKQANKTRPIFNLKTFKNYVHTEKFKLERLDLVKTMLKPNNYLMKRDLKDAYYSVPIAEDHKKYLRFQFQGVTYEYQCLPLRTILSTSSLHQAAQTSDFHSQIIRYTSRDLSGRPVTPPPGCGRITRNFPTCLNSTNRPWVYHQTREVLTVTRASNHLPRSNVGFCEHDHISSSRETQQLTDGLQRDPEKTAVHYAGTFSTIRSNESDCQNRDLGSAHALSFPSTTVHFSPAQERPLHNIPEFQDPPDEASILRARMVVFEPADSGKSFGIDITNDRHDHIDRCHHVHAIFSY